MLVKFALATEGDSTRVRLVETAPSKIEWPEEQKATYADQSSDGWEIHLAHLKDYVSGQPTRHETRAHD
jgi:truncated hemoglobin YjbI